LILLATTNDEKAISLYLSPTAVRGMHGDFARNLAIAGITGSACWLLPSMIFRAFPLS
jgi:hypothetical protein